MQKNKLRGIIGAAAVLLMYHLVIFVVPFVKGPLFWISYGFSLVAFGIAGVAVYQAFKKEDAKSRFYGFPIARIGVIYLAAQLVLSLAFMALGAWILWWIPVLVYAAILVAAVLGLISVEISTEEICRQDQKLKTNVTAMRSLQSKVLQLAAQCDEPQLNKLAEELRYSDPVSNPALADAEADLNAAVDQLQQAVADEDLESVRLLSRQTMSLLAERNRLCKLNKH